MTFKPNPFKLSDNFTALRIVHKMDDALEAYDAEWWTNEMQDATLEYITSRHDRARRAGLKIAWPISGDTIAAIRATA